MLFINVPVVMDVVVFGGVEPFSWTGAYFIRIFTFPTGYGGVEGILPST